MTGWRGYGPAMAGPRGAEVLRAGIGAGLGLLIAGLALRSTGLGWLIAPLGASAVLIFAVPNSPLAQPWSVFVGNGVSALVALLTVAALPMPEWDVPLAVGLAITAMLACRALHPPGGAVALLVALAPSTWTVPLVLLGSAALVAVGVVWNRGTGRVYPFRQPAQPGAHGTTDPAPEARVGVDPDRLAAILEDYRQSANLGVADLARLVGAVEQASAARAMEGFTAADIMSRDLVTVKRTATLAEVANLFRMHGFTALPVVEGERLLGLIFQIDLIRRAADHAFHPPALLAGFSRQRATLAGDILQAATARALPDTPVGALLPLLSDGGGEAVAVVRNGRPVGIVTRSDLVSALARRLAETAVRPG